MAQTTLYAEKYAFVEQRGVYDAHSNALQNVGGNVYDPLFLLRFPALSDSLKYRGISVVELKLGMKGHGYAGPMREQFVADDFDADTVTYATAPSTDDAIELNINFFAGRSGTTNYEFDIPVGYTLVSGSGSKELLEKRTCILRSFYQYFDSMGYSVLSLYTPLYSGSSSYLPQLEVHYSDEDVGVVGGLISIGYPTYWNPHVAKTVNLSFTLPSNTLAPISITQESFFWREVGASTWNEIPLTPGATSVTVPAETFPGASSVEYFVRITCNSGVTDESQICTSSTADTIPTATPIVPRSSVEKGNEPIVFRWDVENDSGSIQTASELEYSQDDGTTWTALATISGSAKTYTAAANTFSAGTVKWRVRAYNIDSVAGSWSTASFVAIAAPAAPTVQSDAVPFATITWQSSGQEAYQIEIDGKDLGSFFGGGKTYTLKTPLEDGSHVVRVRVQNLYGLWSEYGSAEFSVANVPGEAVTLGAEFGADAALFWNTSEATGDFLIFRDEALIGHTARLYFTDRFVLGEHSYAVINRLPSGNYSRSNTVTGRLCVRRPTVAALDGGEWIELKYSEKSMPEQRFTWSRTHSLRHVAGAKWPVLEVSPFEDLSGTYDAAFLCSRAAAKFRALRGEVVIMKSREGKVVIGALVNVSEVVNAFYLSMQFTIEQIAWEDFVDDQNG